MLIYDWRMALACLWGVPVAFGLLFGSRKLAKRNPERTKAAGIQVSDGIQETLENIREIRATNQEGRFLEDLNGKIRITGCSARSISRIRLGINPGALVMTIRKYDIKPYS